MNRQVATLFGVDASTVARWANKGLITYVNTPGGARRYPAAQFHDLLRETPRTSSVNHTGPLGHADSPGRTLPDGW
nr:helix-turn-helix domain-containing protein [Nocardiopsis ansamitocini]